MQACNGHAEKRASPDLCPAREQGVPVSLRFQVTPTFPLMNQAGTGTSHPRLKRRAGTSAPTQQDNQQAGRDSAPPFSP